MKWSELSPREKDALVAEKVFGWKSQGWRFLEIYDEPEWHDENGHEKWSPPPFSQDIAAAWEVVQRIRGGSRLYDFDLYVYGDDEVTATFTTDKEYKAHASTAPEAICLAALKASGVEID